MSFALVEPWTHTLSCLVPLVPCYIWYPVSLPNTMASVGCINLLYFGCGWAYGWLTVCDTSHRAATSIPGPPSFLLCAHWLWDPGQLACSLAGDIQDCIFLQKGRYFPEYYLAFPIVRDCMYGVGRYPCLPVLCGTDELMLEWCPAQIGRLL